MSFIPLGFLAAGGSVPGDFVSLQTATVGSGGASSISFTSIPAAYKHLQIRYSSPLNCVDAEYYMTFNGITTSSYAQHALNGNGSSITAYNNINRGNINFGYDKNMSLNADYLKSGIIDLLDYSNVNKYKTARILNGVDGNGSGVMSFDSGLFRDTTAISSIEIKQFGYNGSTYAYTNFAEYSKFALYGVK
jgi:hypothetical protein